MGFSVSDEVFDPVVKYVLNHLTKITKLFDMCNPDEGFQMKSAGNLPRVTLDVGSGSGHN